MINIQTLSNGARLVKRYRNGRCFACVWAADTTDKQIASNMAQGDAAFFPWCETTGSFVWGKISGRASHFKR